MKEITILFAANAWNEHSSKEIAAVFDNDEDYECYLDELHQTGKLNDDDMEMMKNHDQTQGKETNYLMERHEVNPSLYV